MKNLTYSKMSIKDGDKSLWCISDQYGSTVIQILMIEPPLKLIKQLS
jgi:hypothetical protein